MLSINDIIAQRYRIVTPLGQGGMGITYEAEDLTNYQRVALKAVSLRQAQDWKILELFEREAKVIAHLNHPGIPKYLDYFHLDTAEDRQFYLIRELVPGDSLAGWVEKGWHSTEAKIKQIAIKILEILCYLHQLNPPIIHRDIKPQNIILTSDGEIFLVDFGAVQDIYRNTMSFSGTFVGTIGYMPPEQLRGKAYSSSDLYSLGGTLLYLLTHRSPDELPQQRMKIDFRSCVNISPEFANWLEVMLSPMFEDRFQSATEALNALRNDSAIVSSTSSRVQFSRQKPKGSRVIVRKTSRNLIIKIPPAGFRVEDLFLWFFALIWNGLVSFFILTAGIWMILSYAILHVSVGLGLLTYLFWNSASQTHIQIHSNQFSIHWKCLAFSRTVRGKTADLEQICQNNTGIESNGKAMINCALFEGVKKHQFGSLLTSSEQEWLVNEISDFLQQLNLKQNLKKPH